MREREEWRDGFFILTAPKSSDAAYLHLLGALQRNPIEIILVETREIWGLDTYDAIQF